MKPLHLILAGAMLVSSAAVFAANNGDEKVERPNVNDPASSADITVGTGDYEQHDYGDSDSSAAATAAKATKPYDADSGIMPRGKGEP